MRVAEKQNGAFVLKTPVGVMDYTFAGCQADLVKILPAVNACCITVAFYLEYIKAFKLQFIIESRSRTHILILHLTKLRKSNQTNFSNGKL